jgi:hypothetical protein
MNSPDPAFFFKRVHGSAPIVQLLYVPWIAPCAPRVRQEMRPRKWRSIRPGSELVAPSASETSRVARTSCTSSGSAGLMKPSARDGEPAQRAAAGEGPRHRLRRSRSSGGRGCPRTKTLRSHHSKLRQVRKRFRNGAMHHHAFPKADRSAPASSTFRDFRLLRRMSCRSAPSQPIDQSA